MSGVFISYARSTESGAGPIANALRAAGYAVWRDTDLSAHRAYTEETEEKLRSAEAVLVLWSADAVKSQWVRAEAEVARQARTLVQARLDDAPLPLPFPQIQCADLSGWKGEPDHPEWRKVTASIDALLGRGAPGAAPGSHGGASAARAEPRPPAGFAGRRTAIWAAAALTLAAIAGAGVWLARDRLAIGGAGSSALKIAVLPFEPLSSGQEVRYFADSLQEEISGAISGQQIEAVSRSASAGLRGADAAQALQRLGVRIVLDGAARSDGETMRVRVHLDDPKAKTTLWSREFEAPVKDANLLQARVAHRMLTVLDCARDALEPQGGLTDPALVSRFLRGCDVFANWDVHIGYDPKGGAEYFETQRALTAQAPKFARAQFGYAIAAAITSRSVTGPPASAMRADAEAHLQKGAAMVRNSPWPDATRSMIVPVRAWAERERLLRRAVAVEPGFGLSDFWLGAVLAETGRLQEGLSFTQKSTVGDQVYDWGLFNAGVACLAGRTDPAIKDVEGFRQMVPESLFAQDVNVACLAAGGRWTEAQQVLAGLPKLPTPYRSPAYAALLAAEASRRPADIATARRLALAQADDGPTALTSSIEILAALGQLDDAFALAERYDPDAAGSANPNLFLFSTLSRNLRRDPRFMKLAARIGLVAYWRAGGHWPDFCAEPGLPYDCKAEAAKYA
jgi:TolB-like protein